MLGIFRRARSLRVAVSVLSSLVLILATVTTVSAAQALTSDMYQVACPTYSLVPANKTPASYDATGGHTGDLIATAQTALAASSDIPIGCKLMVGTFDLHPGSAGATPFVAVTTSAIGATNYTTNTAYEAHARAASPGGVWVDDVLPDGYGFGAIRYYRDILFSDNSEDISSVDPGTYSVTCIAFNVKPLITFGTLADKTFGDPTFTVGATSTSPVGITFTATGNCSINGTTVTITGAGSCTVTAHQVGQVNPFWAPAADVSQTFSINKGTPVITFTSVSGSPVVGSPNYTVTATSPSPVAITFALDVTSTGCSISGGNIITYTAVGTCRINANQVANANWNAAAQVPQSIVIGRGTQTLNWTSTTPVGATVGGSYTAAATSNKGVTPVTYSIDSTSTAGACSISGGNLVSFTGVGTCRVDADQAGSVNYNAAAQIQQSIVIGRGTPVITFTSVPGSPVVGSPNYTVTATSPSPVAITFALDVTSTGCSISGGNIITY